MCLDLDRLPCGLTKLLQVDEMKFMDALIQFSM